MPDKFQSAPRTPEGDWMSFSGGTYSLRGWQYAGFLNATTTAEQLLVDISAIAGQTGVRAYVKSCWARNQGGSAANYNVRLSSSGATTSVRWVGVMGANNANCHNSYNQDFGEIGLPWPDDEDVVVNCENNANDMDGGVWYRIEEV